MTPDELEALVMESEDPWLLPKAFAGLTEGQRGKLSAPAQKLLKQLAQGKAGETASPRLKQHLAQRKGDSWNHWNRPQNRNARLAVFAVGPLSAVQKRDAQIWHAEHPVLERIIRDRRPNWIDAWVASELDKDFTPLDFPTIRTFVREGLCQKPAADGYYRLFANHLMRTGHYGKTETHVPPLSEQLLNDPGLLDDIEGLFRVETNAFNTNSWLTAGAAAHYETWPQALAKLSSQGHIERGPLLRLALAGLRLEIKQNQLSGYHRFYLQMEPTEAELLAHQSDYIDLLCHPVGHVAKFAVDMLARVEKLGALDTGKALSELKFVLTSDSKGNAIAALKLIERVIGRGKAPGDSALWAACEALRNRHADVQAKALDMLAANRANLSTGQIDDLRDLTTFVAASHQESLAALVGSMGTQGEVRRDVAEAGDYRPIEGLDAVAPVLGDDARLEPITSLDALIDKMLHLVEVVDSPDDVEQMIDAISRLANDRPDDFDARVAPLLHRMKKGTTGTNGLCAGSVGVGLAVLDLVYSWATGRLHRTDQTVSIYSTQEDAFVPMTALLREITRRVVRCEAQPILAAPTHRGGWVDPLVWVDRLHHLQASADLPASMDFRLSLLRLAPDNRAQALEKIADLPVAIRRIAGFALGADIAPEAADRKLYAAWITAARARAPHRDWTVEFAPLSLSDAWPDGLRPAVLTWRSSHTATRYEGNTWKHGEVSFSVTRGKTGEAPSKGLLSSMLQAFAGSTTTNWEDLPTAALCRMTETKHYWSSDLNTTWIAQWLAGLWPQNPQSAYMKGAKKLSIRMDEGSSNWTPGHGSLHALFQRNRPWGEMGHLLLTMGLCGKDADARALALDALIEGIDARLFHPLDWARVMVKLSEGEWLKYNRLGENLMQVVKTTPLHAAAVGDALQAWLPQLDLSQRNVFCLLDVLVEALAITGGSVTPDAREALDKMSGSGKAAKLAKQLAARV